ncbi:MAG: hypothetical protein ACJA1O_003407 [Spirosomataceae bacterium]|jgi:hypothetical protein
MKGGFLGKLLIIIFYSVSALNAQDFVADDLSEKIPLQTYVNYSVRNSATSLETVISDNN